MDSVMEMAAALRRYVLAHPDACDTAAGIGAWWLGYLQASPEVVAAAVAWLVARGEMEVLSPGLDGQTVYRAARPPERDGDGGGGLA